MEMLTTGRARTAARAKQRTRICSHQLALMSFVGSTAPSARSSPVLKVCGNGARTFGAARLRQRAAARMSSSSPSPPPPPPQSQQPAAAKAFSSACSSASSLNEALADAVATALSALGPGDVVDVAIVFVSARYAVSKSGPRGRESLADVAPCLRNVLPGLKAVFGGTSDGVLGGGREIEGGAGVSITLLRMPGISLKTFHVMPDDVPSLDASQNEWRRLFGNVPADDAMPSFMLLADPTFTERGDLKKVLAGLEFAYPGSAVFGSIASAGVGFSQGNLICTLPRDVLGAAVSTSLRDSGVIGLAMSNCEVECLVSQGCRAMGPTFEVRKVSGPNGNGILEMEQVGRPGSILSATGHLKSLMRFSTRAEQMLLDPSAGALHVAFASSEFDEKVADDNFLVRRVVGFDEDKGAVVLSSGARVGQRLRFVVTEEIAAKSILRSTLQQFKKAELAKTLVGYSNPPLGALLFLDAGRGKKLFKEPDYETREMAEVAPTLPTSGLFTGGQIAASSSGEPAALHNAASVIAVIRNRSAISPKNPPASPTV